MNLETSAMGQQSKSANEERQVHQRSLRNTHVELDPKLVLSTLRHCWYWAGPIGIALGALASFVVYSTFVPVYTASHLLEANQDYIVFDDILQTSSNLSRTERQVVLSPSVLEDAVSQPEMKSLGFVDPIESKDLLRKKLGIGNAGVNTLLEIRYTDEDPETAATVCNIVTKSYLEQRERLDNQRVANLTSWLTPNIDQWKAEVQGYERRIDELTRATLGYDPKNPVEGVEFDMASFAKLRMEIQELRIQESWLETQIAASQNSSIIPTADQTKIEIPEPTTAEIERFVSNDTEVRRQRGLLAEIEGLMRSMDVNGLRQVRNDYYEELEVKADSIRQDLEGAEVAARQKAPEILQRDRREIAERTHEQLTARAAVATVEAKETQKRELARTKARRALAESNYDRERIRLERKGGNAVELMFANEDRAIAAEFLGDMRKRLAAIKIEQHKGSGVHTISRAEPPRKPDEPIPVKNMVVAAVAGLAFPFVIGLLFEFRSQRICDPASFETKALPPILGEVAKLPSKVGQGKRQRIFEESIDTMRANLLLAKDTQGVRSITVASSMSGEGKSSVASQLAISLAKACGRTVLLVDADLRSPDQHDIFGLDMGPGLAGVMSGEASLDAAIDQSLGDLVHVLPAGRMNMSPHRLLAASAVRELIDEALEAYSYVVIDTAPVLSAGETLAVASEADATLVCVMRDVSRTDTVTRSSRRLEAAGANVVGTVFSGVPARQYAYRYGDYRYLAFRTEA